MSYHPRMPLSATDVSSSPSNGEREKTLEADDTSRLARLAYRVVLQRPIKKSRVLGQLTSDTAREVGEAVLGSTTVDNDAIEMADKLIRWARRNARRAIASSDPETK